MYSISYCMSDRVMAICVSTAVYINISMDSAKLWINFMSVFMSYTITTTIVELVLYCDCDTASCSLACIAPKFCLHYLTTTSYSFVIITEEMLSKLNELIFTV